MKIAKKVVSVLVQPSTISNNFPYSSKRTTILLLGWALARDENLAKYSEIYENEGFSTLRFTSTFKGHRRNLKYARDVSGLVDDVRSVLARPDARLALHLFSMNGVYTLCSLMLQHPEMNVLGRSDGIVFDSCPVLFDSNSPRSFNILANTLAKSALKDASLIQRIKFYLWKTCFSIGIRAFIVEQLIRSRIGHNLSNLTPYHFLMEHTSLPHHLSFVYSEKDFICPPRTIYDFHEMMAKKGRNVDVLRLTDSEHVKHYKKYPTEYQALVLRLLSSLERLHTSGKNS